ncbi:hypothetical protein BZG21_13550, partial [Escherichia coli]|nr:hypothetical protein [Escherichia coli]
MLLQTKRDHHGFILIFFQGLAGGHVVGRRGDDAVYAGEESLLQRLVQLHGNDSNLLIVFYVQIMPDDFV